MAYVDAKMNYVVTDQLIKRWTELGFDKDIKIKYSNPTKFYRALKKENQAKEVKKGGYSVNKQDSFPLVSKESVFSGYYSARPLLKQATRQLIASYHSMGRLLAQTNLRNDLNTYDPFKVRLSTLEFSTNIQELIGDLQSFDAIAGSQ